MQQFLIAGGSVPGTDHIKPGEPVWRNNQDSFTWRQTESALVAVVCDGCSKGKYSEAGAQMGSRLIANTLMRFLENGRRFDSERTLYDLKRRLTKDLRNIIRIISRGEENFVDAIADYLLFTTVAAVIDHERAVVLTLGDGVFAINGEVTVLYPRVGNAPAYLAYNLGGYVVDQDDLDFKLQASLPTQEVESILIGSDGVTDLIENEQTPLPYIGKELGPLSQFWEDPKFVTNEDMIRRRLAMANREHVQDGRIRRGLLHDDTSLIVIRRMAEGE